MASRAEYARLWRARNPEKVRVSNANRKEYLHDWYLKNREFWQAHTAEYQRTEKGREVSRAAARKWAQANPEKVKQKNRANAGRRASTTKRWLAEHPEWRRNRDSKKRKTDLNFCIKDRIRRRINQLLKKNGVDKTGRTESLLGCTIGALRTHLESLFQVGMTWENRGLWEIDHKRPCASFDLTDIEQQKACFHFTNLQPLWASDNRRKWAHI